MLPNWTFVVLVIFSLLRLNRCVPTADKRTGDIIYSHYGSGGHCEIDGQFIPHGEMFTDPSMSRCLQHQCVYGSGYIVSEGCEGSDDVCHNVDEIWEERCITYTCTKTTIGGYNYFQPIVQNARCWDANGECHEPGELFSYRLQGRIHSSCRCNITDNKIFYRCF